MQYPADLSAHRTRTNQHDHNPTDRPDQSADRTHQRTDTDPHPDTHHNIEHPFD